ncbi:MAG: signal recognition particle-docking protein FtsY [Planctomycetes bacterium SM23_32]|nr:MAG: signal recognition particle-docking protein FtsY [Planctomycetes bacterium SM23_32]
MSEQEHQQPTGLLGRLRSGLQKTRLKVTGGLRSVLAVHRTLDEELLEEIEEALYVADIGPRAVMRLCEGLRKAYREGRIEEPDQVLDYLKAQMTEDLSHWDTALHLPAEGTGVILVAGVNGSGKTTSIAKLAHMFVRRGKRVLLAASDTFRAAGVEQLRIWAERVGADLVRNESADPAAVAFDAAEKALANDYDVLIIDTAGRLHTRTSLMMELEKIRRVVGNKMPGAPHETLLVLDATTGQNAVSQALRFHESLKLTGIILAKLDGTAKGGIVCGMRDQIDMPVKFVGLGEGPDDLMAFDPEQFVEALFE